MSRRAEAWDQRTEPVGKSLGGSVMIHLAALAALFSSGLLQRSPISLGVPNPGAGAVGVTPVKMIPIPSHEGRVNRLASDSQSLAPQAPPKVKEQVRVEPPPPKAIPIPSRVVPKRPEPLDSSRSSYRKPDAYERNQIFSRAPERLTSPDVGVQGGGGVGIGPNSPFGYQFGAYAQQLRDLIAAKWNTSDVTARQGAQAVIVFTLTRNGAVSDVRLSQSSGSYTMDTSAKRAVLDASPLPPLPAGFGRAQADIELYFQLKQ